MSSKEAETLKWLGSATRIFWVVVALVLLVLAIWFESALAGIASFCVSMCISVADDGGIEE